MKSRLVKGVAFILNNLQKFKDIYFVLKGRREKMMMLMGSGLSCSDNIPKQCFLPQTDRNNTNEGIISACYCDTRNTSLFFFLFSSYSS